MGIVRHIHKRGPCAARLGAARMRRGICMTKFSEDEIRGVEMVLYDRAKSGDLSSIRYFLDRYGNETQSHGDGADYVTLASMILEGLRPPNE